MKKKIINLITYLFTLGLGIFFIWLSLKDLQPADIEEIKLAVRQANYNLLIPIIIMGLVSHWSRAVRWRCLMEPLGYTPSIKNTFFAVMIGYLANLAFPRLGEVLKCTILARYEKVPADKLVGTIIAERAFDLLCLIILFFVTFLVQIDFATDYINSLLEKMRLNRAEGSGGYGWYYLSAVALLIALVIIFRKKIGAFGFVIKIKNVLLNIMSGITSFKNMKNKGVFVLHTVLIWAMYLGMIVIGFQSINETNMLGLKAGFSVLSFGSVGMIVTPGGIGMYTKIVQEIVELYSIKYSISVAISWIIWLVPTFIIIVAGLISMVLLPLLNKKTNAE